MNKLILLLLASYALFADEKEGKIQENTTFPEEGLTHKTFSMLGGPVKYQLNYRIRKNQASGLESVGDTSTRSTGLGLNYGWYANGFLRVVIDGKSVTAPASEIVSLGKILVFRWPNVTLKLSLPENSDRIFGEITAPTGSNLMVAFLANPGYKNKRQDYLPWITSGNAHRKLSKETPFVQSHWIMAYDGMDNPRGIASILFNPEQMQNIEFSGTGKSSIISILFKVRENRFRFMLQGIPDSHLDAESLFETLQEKGDQFLEELKQFQFEGA